MQFTVFGKPAERAGNEPLNFLREKVPISEELSD